MNRFPLYITALAMLLIVSCSSEKKVASYEVLYKESPATILVGPIQDSAKRADVKTKQDEVFNAELADAATFMQQTLADPLLFQGYYVLPPLVSDVIIDKAQANYKSLSQGDIAFLASQYGVDAVLLVAIHKWQEPEVNEVVVYAEYTLRSTKTGQELAHTWVRGEKIQPVDTYGEPVNLQSDDDFIKSSGLPNRLAHRCILLQQMSDFVLRSLPTSVNRWNFKHDQYIPSNPSYYSFVINPDGSLERKEYTEDALGNECFQN